MTIIRLIDLIGHHRQIGSRVAAPGLICRRGASVRARRLSESAMAPKLRLAFLGCGRICRTLSRCISVTLCMHAVWGRALGPPCTHYSPSLRVLQSPLQSSSGCTVVGRIVWSVVSHASQSELPIDKCTLAVLLRLLHCSNRRRSCCAGWCTQRCTGTVYRNRRRTLFMLLCASTFTCLAPSQWQRKCND